MAHHSDPAGGGAAPAAPTRAAPPPPSPAPPGETTSSQGMVLPPRRHFWLRWVGGLRARGIRDTLQRHRRSTGRTRRSLSSPGSWDQSIEVEDFGRGCPVDSKRSSAGELVFCELYAGGKYKNGGEITTSIPWASTALAPAPPSTPANISTRSSTGTAPNTPSTLRRGRTSAGCTRSPPTGAKDGLHHPLEAGSGGLYRHRHPRGVLPGRDEAPGCG